MSARRSSRWRCAHRDSERAKRSQQVRTYNTFHQTLTEMVAWLVSEGVTHVTMEATGIYWKPIFHALCEAEGSMEVLLVNARHVKNVPGRKSDALDAAWLAELTECGLLRGSLMPPPQIGAIRELTRYRKKLRTGSNPGTAPHADLTAG
jgi:transposase